jgi:DUF438 domain-containing protein
MLKHLVCLTVFFFVTCMQMPSAFELKHLDLDDFHHLGNFLRSMQKVKQLNHLYQPFQKYIMQRSVRGANSVEPLEVDDQEESIFFSIFNNYGKTDSAAADWSVDDIAEVKRLCTKLIKLMTRRRRLEEAENGKGL